MDFQQKISDYQESQAAQSPIWIWFQKTSEKVTCLICNTNVTSPSGTTSNLIAHLRRHHGPIKKYNAYKEYEDLSKLKQERQNTKRKNSVAEPEQQPAAKQQKINDSLLQKYPTSHPRHKSLVNAIGMMICTDAAPTSIGKRCCI